MTETTLSPGRVFRGDTGRFFEELEVGDRFISPARTITEADVVNFMGVSGIFEELHMSVEYMKTRSIFGGRVAPGPLAYSVSEGLAVMTGFLHGTGMALLETHMKFVKPARVGDTIHTEVVITAKRETSKPDRGLIRHTQHVYNQTGELIMEVEKVRLVKRRQQAEDQHDGR